MSHKIFDNNLVAIRKSKLALKVNKLAYIQYIRMHYLELRNKFLYDYIKNKYDNKSQLLFTEIDIIMYEIKTEDVYKDFSSDKEMYDFNNYLTR